MQSEKIRILVADSGAFIKGAPLQQWSSNIVTIKDVVNEIRDANTRQRLQVLPYELTFREPSQAAISHGKVITVSNTNIVHTTYYYYQ